MAKAVVTATFLTLGGTDRSALASSVTLSMSAPEVDVTNFDSAGWKEFLAGLKEADLSIDWKKDADLSTLDSQLWTAFSAGTSLAFVIRLSDAAIGPTNPSYSGSVLISNHSPIQNAVGDAYGGSATYKVTGAVTRATA